MKNCSDIFLFRTNFRTLLLLTLGALALTFVLPVLAASTIEEPINWYTLIMGMFGGLAIFLIGLDMLSGALQAAAGEKLKIILARLTTNRIKGMFTGALVTALLNSSTVTTILVVGFITAGVMNLTQSVGIIFGANVGSTFTAQIIAFNIAQYSLAMIAVGYLISLAAKNEQLKHYGTILTGLGLVFFGMGIIGEVMDPLREYQPFIDLMVAVEKPTLGISVGLFFTALVNSSAATLGIAIVMASDGLITLEAGIALAIGANIGTIFTTLIASIGKPRDAVRAASVHALFNIIGSLIWLPLIPQLASITTWLSPSHPEMVGIERMAAEVPRQIANAHTVFNTINALFFLNFTALFVRAVVWMFPDKPVEPPKVIIEPAFLSKELIETPTLALESVRKEFGRMGAIAQEMMLKIREGFIQENFAVLKEVEKMDDQIDLLHDFIINYLGQIRTQPLNKEQDEEFINLLSATDDLESLADVIEIDLVKLIRIHIETEEIKYSETINSLMEQLNVKLMEAFQNAVSAVEENNPQKAQDVLVIKDEFENIIEMALRHQAKKLKSDEDPAWLAGFRIEMEVLDKLERIYRLARRIAKTVLPAEILIEK